jgi:hypothetical protein
MLAAERSAGLVTRDEMLAQMEAWRRGWRTRLGVAVLPPIAWVIGDAAIVATREEAVAALASAPPLSTMMVDYNGTVDPTMPAALGHTLLLAGRFDEAIPLLEEVAHFCQPVRTPLAPTYAALDLGVALEALGRKDRACEAYGSIVGHLGHAKPRSVTAEKAAERTKALGCTR